MARALRPERREADALPGVVHISRLEILQPPQSVDAETLRVARQSFDGVAGSDLTFLTDAQVEPGPAAPYQQFRELRHVHADAEFEARHSRLRHLDDRSADAVDVAEPDVLFEQSLGGEVLAELPEDEVGPAQFSRPRRAVLERVDVNSLVESPVDAEVSLAVAIEVESAQGDAACDRLLEDAGGDGPAAEFDDLRR
jgi:hypothetical protein